MRLGMLIICAIFVTSTASPVLAGNADINIDGSVTWQAGVDGVEIEWAPDGTIRRLYSRYSTPVEFADRRGISKAQIIAEEKAKANIVRYLNQSVSSSRVVAEVQADINKATQLRETDERATVKKVDERTIIESLTELTTSFSAGSLRGVIVLEKGYDDKLEEVWVTVGISDKTIAAARGVQNMINNKSTTAKDSDGLSKMGVQQSEIRKSKEQDW